MNTVTECAEPANQRSLKGIINFLEEYHPTSPEKMSVVTTLRDRIRTNPQKEDLLDLADAISDTGFALRKGVVKTLPGLASRIRSSALALEHKGDPAERR